MNRQDIIYLKDIRISLLFCIACLLFLIPLPFLFEDRIFGMILGIYSVITFIFLEFLGSIIGNFYPWFNKEYSLNFAKPRTDNSEVKG